MDRCHRCGADLLPGDAHARVILGRPDRPDDFYVFSKSRKRMTRVGKPKGPGVVGPRAFCRVCADYLDELLDQEAARLRNKKRWALLAGAILVALLLATAVAVALH